MNKKWKGHIAILCASVLFGINIPISKSLLDTIGPFGWSFTRASVACLCFWIVSLLLPRERLVCKRDFWMLVVCALFGMVVNQLFFVVGLASTSSIDASIISTTVPVLVMLIAALVLKEPITHMKVAGVLIGAAGALLLVLSGAHSAVGSKSLHGDLFCLGSSLSYAVYLVISKPLAQRYSPVTVMKWTFLFSSCFLLPTSMIDLGRLNIAAFDTQLSLQVSYSLILGTFVPYLLVPLALKKLRPTTISMYNYVQPLVASLLAVIVLHDSFTWLKCLAAVLVFTGVYVVNKSKSRAQMEAEKAASNTQIADNPSSAG
ncbi:MAG: DMT family transporter [Bacteroidales bacterium]|jgi:drug/metabolite transporter (DMT)-like permease|nr:DMT family transporter [Bacteroidales bacterium]